MDIHDAYHLLETLTRVPCEAEDPFVSDTDYFWRFYCLKELLIDFSSDHPSYCHNSFLDICVHLKINCYSEFEIV